MATNLPKGTDWSQYFDPAAFNTPSGAGQQPGTKGYDPILGGALGGIGGFIGDLFGSDPSFKPYVDANGNYVFTNPKKNNPVPVASVPGASLKPSSTYKQT